MDDDKIIYKDLSYRIVGLAMEVHNKLKSGFLEKVYENAMMVLFRREGINAAQQASIKVNFEGEEIGAYFADILVENNIILELKVAANISNAHKAQVINYLKATGVKLAIILNFGNEELEFERIVF
ncbi:GxxExxY protein [candidate division KSB1 bacterium]|nr:GxxExxY protein [candidate division KSB1 bacterium]